MVLLIASLLFYTWGEVGYIILLLSSILINFIFGLLIEKFSESHQKKKLFLFAGVLINLLFIIYFKYFNFIAESILTIKLNEHVHLPLGISFFTFQAISYLVDVYRKDAKVEKNLFNLALFISMFPQLIAGPIVRFKSIASSIRHRVSTLGNISKGMRIFIIGLGQKALIANTVAVVADDVFKLPESSLTILVSWLGAVCYSLQIYFDFAGYSNMAIGLGLMMGFTFPKNFNYPYVSQSITEFWRRWHMSLSSWFRDYLYIPLGGNRVTPIRVYLNLMLVFLLCGLWHGAAWTFIIWGAYHGFFLMLEKYKVTHLLNKVWRPLRHGYTLIVIIVGWVIFRANNFNHLYAYLKSMFGFGIGNNKYDSFHILLSNSLMTAIIIGLVLSLPVYNKIQTMGNKAVNTIVMEVFYLSTLLFSLINVASGSYNPFIYFRF